MGQYYKPINIDNKQWLYSHEYDSGLKIMEHSWVGNLFVGRVMALLVKGGKWYKNRLVWAGDYYGGKEDGDTGPLAKPWFCAASDSDKIKPSTFLTKKEQSSCFLVNHTKKMYVSYASLKGQKGWIINPLPLLTALGNGRGGGDYHDNWPCQELIGTWAGDILSVEF
jgi:hypothetical protein